MFIKHIPTRILGLANNYSLDLVSSSSQYASITDASQTGLDLTTAFTVEYWVKRRSVGTSMGIAGKYDSLGNNRSYRVYFNGSDGLIYLQVSSNGTSSSGQFLHFTSTNAYETLNTWFHVAVTFDVSTETAVLYIDGTSVGFSLSSGTSLGASLYNNSEPFYVGARKNGGSQAYFDGLLNTLRIWNVVRSASEINNNKELVLSSGTGLVSAWYSTNNDHDDLTATGNDLTAINSPTFSTDVPF